jgi:general stress protein 26
MSEQKEFEAKFWKSIRSDMSVMLSVTGSDECPMTAQFDREGKTIYFFTSKDTELATKLTRPKKASLIYAAKKHDLFATVHGMLKIDNGRDTINRLWNRFVAAWFEKGRTTQSCACFGSNQPTRKSGSTRPALLPDSKCFWALGIPSKIIRIALPRSG